MKMHVRLFEPKKSICCTQELDGENIPVPRIGEIIYINDYPCKVSDVNYTYNDLAKDTCNIDIITESVPAEWWDEVYEEVEAAESKQCGCEDKYEHEPSGTKPKSKSEYDCFNELLDQLEELSNKLHDKFNIKISYDRW